MAPRGKPGKRSRCGITQPDPIPQGRLMLRRDTDRLPKITGKLIRSYRHFRWGKPPAARRAVHDLLNFVTAPEGADLDGFLLPHDWRTRFERNEHFPRHGFSGDAFDSLAQAEKLRDVLFDMAAFDCAREPLTRRDWASKCMLSLAEYLSQH